MAAPCLLQRIFFDTTVGGRVKQPARLLRRARSFCSWLAAHGAAGAVAELDLRIGAPYLVDPGGDTPHFFPEIACALAACSGSLRRVRLHLQFLLDVRFPAALVATLRHVSSLRLEVEAGDLSLDVPLSGMQQLQELYLAASPGRDAHKGLTVAPSASLPHQAAL